jgi:FAD dependent oxidoreductase./Rieske [2Fe-2S] domain.
VIFINSVWHESIKLKKFPKLNEDTKTDVLIIGGGLAGILCAYFLERQGVNYILVEARKIGMGITKNTTAKITFQHSLIYSNLIKNYGLERARQYFQANKMALKLYVELCKNMECDFEEKPAVTYSTNSVKNIEEEILALEKLNYKAQFLDKIPIPIKISGAIKFENQAQFNPLKFMANICENLNIYEDTFIHKLDENKAFTENAKIQAKKIIIATHFPFINSHGSYFLKMYQSRAYVVAVQNAAQVDGMYVDESQNGMSFRNYKDLLLVGGGDHRTGKGGSGYEGLREFVKVNYPRSREKYFWATQDCMTLDNIPYIGQYSRNTPNWFVATGFNKWGMTSSMVAAKILSDLVLEKKNDFSEVFSPSRSILKPQLFVNLGETILNFFTPTLKRCPHLGCALKWNKYEHSWDCPCHGSRFTEQGKIIDNPAKRDAHV